MTDAPKRIWVDYTAHTTSYQHVDTDNPQDGSTEYIRYDLADLGERSKEMENALIRWVDFGKYLKNEYIMKFYANDSVALSRALRETEELLQRLKGNK